jgi:hypothetical protein
VAGTSADWRLRTAPDPEIRSDPDIQACGKVVKPYPLNDRGSPFCFEPGSINQGRATSPFFEVRNLMKKLGSALTSKFVALG